MLPAISKQDTYKGEAGEAGDCDDDALDAGLCWFDWWDVVVVMHGLLLDGLECDVNGCVIAI